MNAGKITAKLRDAVPVCLYAEGEEKARYKNIELPDSIKALEIRDFHFDIDAAGWISFRLHFDQGILPEELPASKPPVTREQKRAAKAAKLAAAPEPIEIPEELDEAPAPGEDYTIATSQGAVIAEVHHVDLTDPAPEEPVTEQSEATESHRRCRFDVPGKKRGALAKVVAEILACEAEYLNPPSYAYRIGALTLDRDGSIIGELPSGLLDVLAEQGFTPAAA